MSGRFPNAAHAPKGRYGAGIPAMFGAGPAGFGAAVKLNCPYCFGLGWVCENHL
jgi:hypothetical protein